MFIGIIKVDEDSNVCDVSVKEKKNLVSDIEGEM